MSYSGDSYQGRCSVCGRGLIGDSLKGELLCPTCGFVLYERIEDLGPEWKAIDLAEKEKRVRVGAPSTFVLHDYGLSTQIAYQPRDYHGRYLDSAVRESLGKLRLWQSRVRTSTSRQRSLSNVLGKIAELCDALSVPRSVTETAAYIYRTCERMRVSKSKSIMGMTAASVYLACRKCGISRTLAEVAQAARLERGVAARYYRMVLRDVEKEYVPPPSLAKYISKLVNMANLSPKIERLGLTLAQKTLNSDISSGKAPSGLAAAYVYISSVLMGEHLPQREVAEVAQVTEVTVRNRCKEILGRYVVRQTLAPMLSR